MGRRSRSGQSLPEPDPTDRSGNAASFVAMPRTLPPFLTAGGRYEVAITMRNDGTSVWSAAGHQPHRLGSQRPRDNTRWGVGRIDVPSDIPPGAETTFVFAVVAPEAPGRYHFQWRMVQDGVGWFGEPSANIVVRTGPSTDESTRTRRILLLHHVAGPDEATANTSFREMQRHELCGDQD